MAIKKKILMKFLHYFQLSNWNQGVHLDILKLQVGKKVVHLSINKCR